MKKYTHKLKSKKSRTQRKRGGGLNVKTNNPLRLEEIARNKAKIAENKAKKNANRQAMVNRFVAASGQDPQEKIGPY
jgi:hypothetical protein